MITQMNKACKPYHTKELCQLLKLPRSSYYYQIKDKPVNDNTNAMIKFIKQTAIEVKHTYGKRRMQVALKNKGWTIGVYQTATSQCIAQIIRHCYLFEFKQPSIKLTTKVGVILPELQSKWLVV